MFSSIQFHLILANRPRTNSSIQVHKGFHWSITSETASFNMLPHTAILSIWHYLLIVAETQYLHLLNILVSFYIFLSKSKMVPLLLNHSQGHKT